MFEAKIASYCTLAHLTLKHPVKVTLKFLNGYHHFLLHILAADIDTFICTCPLWSDKTIGLSFLLNRTLIHPPLGETKTQIKKLLN